MEAAKALSLLLEGNKRFINENNLEFKDLETVRQSVVKGQKPIAAVLGCADSRVPAELVFHQGPGGIFSVRVAGNIINNDIIASLEYAILHLDVNLILVLGHTSCGAVTAAINGGDASDELKGLLSSIHLHPESTEINDNVNFNIKEVSRKLKTILDRWDTGERDVEVVGAVYHLEDGKVEVLENNLLK